MLLCVFTLGACVSSVQEQQIGDMIAGELNNQLPIIRDPLIDAYLNLLARDIVEASGREDINYRFYVLNSPQVNAFALPGGHIYLTRGLIARTQNAAELTGAIAHEIGHVSARHGAKKLERQLRTGSLMGMLYRFILGTEPEWSRSSVLALGSAVWTARHSRGDEEEADRLAVKYMLEANQNPIPIVTLLETLRIEEGRDSTMLASWFSTHPLTEERIKHVVDEIEKLSEGEPLPPQPQDPLYEEFLRRVASFPPPR